jgi:hypothetical protein
VPALLRERASRAEAISSRMVRSRGSSRSQRWSHWVSAVAPALLRPLVGFYGRLEPPCPLLLLGSRFALSHGSPPSLTSRPRRSWISPPVAHGAARRLGGAGRDLPGRTLLRHRRGAVADAHRHDHDPPARRLLAGRGVRGMDLPSGQLAPSHVAGVDHSPPPALSRRRIPSIRRCSRRPSGTARVGPAAGRVGAGRRSSRRCRGGPRRDPGLLDPSDRRCARPGRWADAARCLARREEPAGHRAPALD